MRVVFTSARPFRAFLAEDAELLWIQHSAPLILATVVWRRSHFARLRLGLGARAEEGAQKWNSGSRFEDGFGSRSRRRDELGTDGGESDEGRCEDAEGGLEKAHGGYY